MFNVQFFHQTQLDTARFYLFALSISLSLPSSKYDHHYPISLNKNWGRFFFFCTKRGRFSREGGCLREAIISNIAHWKSFVLLCH